MKAVVMSVGIPGSGKTTLLRLLAIEQDMTYVCLDDIRHELAGDASNHSREAEVWSTARERVARALESGKSVAMDATFSDQQKRHDFALHARASGADKVYALVFDTPLAVAKERNQMRERVVDEDVIEERHGALTANPPSLADGFDALFAPADLARLKAGLGSQVL